MSFSSIQYVNNLRARIKVIGVGGGGGNAINTMVRQQMDQVELIVANTDAQALAKSEAPIKIQLGQNVTAGLGAGANPIIGYEAAIEDEQRLRESLEGADMVFVTSGMGGGTGTGAAPVVARIAREMNALTVGVVTLPFLIEGKKRMTRAQEGITKLREEVDSLIVIPNQRLISLCSETTSMMDSFKLADQVLVNAVRGISDLIHQEGQMNVDFADVRTIMSNRGLTLMGTGVAEGENRALSAAQEAISSPLLNDVSVCGATSLLINFSGSYDMKMMEVEEAARMIQDQAHEDVNCIIGTVIDESLGEKIKITVIATGFEQDAVNIQGNSPKPAPQRQNPPNPSYTSTNYGDYAPRTFESSAPSAPTTGTPLNPYGYSTSSHSNDAGFYGANTSHQGVPVSRSHGNYSSGASNQAYAHQGVSQQGVSQQGISQQGISQQGISQQGISQQGTPLPTSGNGYQDPITGKSRSNSGSTGIYTSPSSGKPSVDKSGVSSQGWTRPNPRSPRPNPSLLGSVKSSIMPVSSEELEQSDFPNQPKFLPSSSNQRPRPQASSSFRPQKNGERVKSVDSLLDEEFWERTDNESDLSPSFSPPRPDWDK